MQQELELKRLLALVAHVDHGLQAVLGERYAVHQPKVERPLSAHLLRQVGCVKAKIELDRVGVEGVLVGRLAQILPAGIASEAVLGEARGGVTRRGRRAKHLSMALAEPSGCPFLFHNCSPSLFFPIS